MEMATIDQIKTQTPQPTAQVAGRRVEFDYLRAFVVVLVVWHHAILAYATFSAINPGNPIETFSPVVDSQRWSGFDLMAGFNDIFFMALMFFISGLFVWRSLARKGAWQYLGDRLIRLGIPFVIGVLFLIPLAYYPAQLTVELVYGGETSFADFWLDMARAGFGTAGPLWFVWLLLVFDGLVALFYGIAAKNRATPNSRTIALFAHPLPFFGALFGLSTLAYLPMVIIYGPQEWVNLGPFAAQASRILFYLLYFVAGTAVGAYGIDRSLLQSGGPLAKRWWVWLIVGPISFLVMIILIADGPPQLIDGIAFTLACATLVFAFVALFLRFATRRVGILSSLAASAYGIYIVHYSWVTWLQFWLLDADLGAIAKALLAFVGTLLLSWGVVAVLRRIPAVARVI